VRNRLFYQPLAAKPCSVSATAWAVKFDAGFALPLTIQAGKKPGTVSWFHRPRFEGVFT